MKGQEILDSGSHEVRVFNAIPADGITPADLAAKVGAIAKFGQAAAFKSKWIGKGDGGKLFRLVESVDDITQQNLAKLDTLDETTIAAYKKRKLVTVEKSTSYCIFKGEEFTTEIVQQETDVTVEMV
jgi:phenylalanyl-tRNA synthetase alpha chain